MTGACPDGARRFFPGVFSPPFLSAVPLCRFLPAVRRRFPGGSSRQSLCRFFPAVSSPPFPPRRFLPTVFSPPSSPRRLLPAVSSLPAPPRCPAPLSGRLLPTVPPHRSSPPFLPTVLSRRLLPAVSSPAAPPPLSGAAFRAGNVKPALNMFPRGIKRPDFPYLRRGYVTGF